MGTILAVEGILTPSCSKSHIIYCFHVNQELKGLEIQFSYTPKKLLDRKKSNTLITEGIRNFMEDHEQHMDEWETYMPVQNLLTISVDDAERFRGCVHRQSPQQQLFIGVQDATPGLIKGKLPPGQYRVTISAHAVVTDTCAYKLRILEVESDD